MLLDSGPLSVIYVNLSISNAFTMKTRVEARGTNYFFNIDMVCGISTLAHRNINLIDFQSIVSSLLALLAGVSFIYKQFYMHLLGLWPSSIYEL